MKKYTFTIVAVLGISALFSFRNQHITIEKFDYAFAHLKNGAGAPSGRTGAPGESSCTSCHSGSAQSGTTENALLLLAFTLIAFTKTPLVL